MKNYHEREMEKKNREQRQGASLITLTDPKSVVAEQFRTIRTNIRFSVEKNNYKSIMFTSSGAWEGKSTIAANVAVAMAYYDDYRVLLIDGDMRKPTVHKTFGIETKVGLSSLLTDRDLNFMKVAQYIPEANLYVIPSGPSPSNPAELLSSDRMANLLDEMENTFDLVIIDTPPILVVTDAQIIANLADSVVFVLREGVSQVSNVEKSKTLLDSVNANVIGAIYNGAHGQAINSYYGYGYGEDYDVEE